MMIGFDDENLKRKLFEQSEHLSIDGMMKKKGAVRLTAMNLLVSGWQLQIGGETPVLLAPNGTPVDPATPKPRGRCCSDPEKKLRSPG
ncbi:MAG: hypothetical protein SNJ49_15470, partial [Chloracidobacterium sp.]